MLAAMTDLRPKRSISHPPIKPKTPPHNAVIQRRRPIHSLTSGLLMGTPSSSAMAGGAASGVINNS